MRLFNSSPAVWAPGLRMASAFLLAILLVNVIVPPASAYYFEGYVNWANNAFQGGPSDPSCRTSAVDLLDFVYAVVYGAVPTVGTARLTQACLNCSQALDSTLALMPSPQPNACPLLRDPSRANLTAVSLRRFVCMGASGGGAGACVVQVVAALNNAGLLERVRLQDPTLQFRGSLLQRMCRALVPPRPAVPTCCARTWAYLMAALAQQSCLPALAQEYLSFPGRCEAVGNTSVPGFCESSWAQDLLLLLSPPPVCKTSSATAAAVPSWTNGTACSSDQLDRLRNASNSCDLWCGLVGDIELALNGDLPPKPTPGPNNNGTNQKPGDIDDGDDDDGDGLHTVTIVIVCVFSSLIFIILVIMACVAVLVYLDNKAIAREHFEFDQEMSLPPDTSKPPSEAPSVPSTPRVPPPPDAAAAGDLTQTPRYEPGPPVQPAEAAGADPDAAAAAAGAAAAAEAASREFGGQRAGPSGAQRGAVPRVGSSSSGLYRNSGGTVARALVYDKDVGGSSMNSRSSKYESAASIFPKSWGAASGPASGPVLGRLSSAFGGSEMAAALAADKLQSHRVSLTDSDIIYQTAHSPELEGILTRYSAGTSSAPPGSALLGAATGPTASPTGRGASAAGSGSGRAAGLSSRPASRNSDSLGSTGSAPPPPPPPPAEGPAAATAAVASAAVTPAADGSGGDGSGEAVAPTVASEQTAAVAGAPLEPVRE